MARLYRPYIPIDVRIDVAWRQLVAAGMAQLVARPERRKRRAWLEGQLRRLFPFEKCELHHRPALLNRRRYIRNGKTFYDPPANDPAHLVYLPEDTHDIETRVRGVGAQRSDLSQSRYNKKVAKNRKGVDRIKRGGRFGRKTKVSGSTGSRTRRNQSVFPKSASQVKRFTDSSPKLRFPKRKWPSRPFPKRSKG